MIIYRGTIALILITTVVLVAGLHGGTASLSAPTVDGHGVKWWANRAHENAQAVRWQRKHAAELTRRLSARIAPLRPGYATIIRLAAVTYGQPFEDMWRVAICESEDFRLATQGRNSVPVWNGEYATGLYQFLPSTWASTPYAKFDILDPVASALAAGWMWQHGRRGEWACR